MNRLGWFSRHKYEEPWCAKLTKLTEEKSATDPRRYRGKNLVADHMRFVLISRSTLAQTKAQRAECP